MVHGWQGGVLMQRRSVVVQLAHADRGRASTPQGGLEGHGVGSSGRGAVLLVDTISAGGRVRHQHGGHASIGLLCSVVRGTSYYRKVVVDLMLFLVTVQPHHHGGVIGYKGVIRKYNPGLAGISLDLVDKHVIGSECTAAAFWFLFGFSSLTAEE